jgi:vitellogenic carboxypeptidase-like protein
MSDSGQNDIILGPPLTENALRSPALATWSRQADFVKAPKAAWHVGADLAGYARAVGNFAYVVVRGAGHMVPGDQPVRALDLITRFVEGRPFL